MAIVLDGEHAKKRARLFEIEKEKRQLHGQMYQLHKLEDEALDIRRWMSEELDREIWGIVKP